MTRCNCDIPFCDGIECYLAEHEPADEPTISTLTLEDCKKLYGNPFGTVCEGDPLRRVA